MQNEFECKDADGNLMVRTPVKTAMSIDTVEYKNHVKSIIRKHNEWNKSSKAGTFVFPDYATAHLWIEELMPQISDGKYENTDNTKWKWFGSLKVEVNELMDAPKIYAGFDRPKHAHLSFTDLIWLFDSPKVLGIGDIKERGEVRNVMSRVPTAKLKDMIKGINHAVNER